jgi:hypothetical protein
VTLELSTWTSSTSPMSTTLRLRRRSTGRTRRPGHRRSARPAGHRGYGITPRVQRSGSMRCESRWWVWLAGLGERPAARNPTVVEARTARTAPVSTGQWRPTPRARRAARAAGCARRV